MFSNIFGTGHNYKILMNFIHGTPELHCYYTATYIYVKYFPLKYSMSCDKVTCEKKIYFHYDRLKINLYMTFNQPLGKTLLKWCPRLDNDPKSRLWWHLTQVSHFTHTGLEKENPSKWKFTVDFICRSMSECIINKSLFIQNQGVLYRLLYISIKE